MSHIISGLASHYGGSVRSPKQLKAKPGNEFLGLSRCAACYNHDASSSQWHGGNGDSSSSEDSGSEGDCESEAESSSSSSRSGHVAAATRETPETQQLSDASGAAAAAAAAAGPGCAGRGETPQSQEHTIRASAPTRRAPLVKSLSLPSSVAPHLTPSTLLPRPPRLVSTLQLQVLPEQHEDAAFVTVHQHPSARQYENTEQSYGGADGRNSVLHPQPVQWQQTGLPWQLYPWYQQQQQVSPLLLQQLPHNFPPCSAWGQTLPPTLPALQPLALLQAQPAPQSHPHMLGPQPCISCYQMHYWSHYSSGDLLRW